MNTKIITQRGYGKTYRIVQSAIETALSDDENKTVILCGLRPSVKYIMNIINNKWSNKLSDKAPVISPNGSVVFLKDNKKILIKKKKKEALITYLVNDYNIFIDDIDYSSITGKDKKFGFSCNIE